MKDYNGNELHVGDKVTYIGYGTYLLDGTIKKITSEWVFIHCDDWDSHPTHRRRSKNIIKKNTSKEEFIKQACQWMQERIVMEDDVQWHTDLEPSYKSKKDRMIEDFKNDMKD